MYNMYNLRQYCAFIFKPLEWFSGVYTFTLTRSFSPQELLETNGDFSDSFCGQTPCSGLNAGRVTLWSELQYVLRLG